LGLEELRQLGGLPTGFSYSGFKVEKIVGFEAVLRSAGQTDLAAEAPSWAASSAADWAADWPTGLAEGLAAGWADH